MIPRRLSWAATEIRSGVRSRIMLMAGPRCANCGTTHSESGRIFYKCNGRCQSWWCSKCCNGAGNSCPGCGHKYLV